MSHPAVSEAAFEERYQRAIDPWDFATSSYERARYAATLASLGQPWYRRAFEPGCSIGVLTAALAARCGRVLATDLAPSAVARAQARCARLSNVDIHHANLMNGPPPGLFDLIVLSEVGYYFATDDLRTVAATLAGALEQGGEFVAVHWLGESADHRLHGDVVHQILRDTLPCEWVKGARHAGFRIDSWRMP